MNIEILKRKQINDVLRKKGAILFVGKFPLENIKPIVLKQ
jgi:hypothetical protein